MKMLHTEQHAHKPLIKTILIVLEIGSNILSILHTKWWLNYILVTLQEFCWEFDLAF